MGKLTRKTEKLRDEQKTDQSGLEEHVAKAVLKMLGKLIILVSRFIHVDLLVVFCWQQIRLTGSHMPEFSECRKLDSSACSCGQCAMFPRLIAYIDNTLVLIIVFSFGPQAL